MKRAVGGHSYLLAAYSCSDQAADEILDVKKPLESEQERKVTMDWSDCPLVEVKPGVQRGRPVLKGTRMPADDIGENWEAGWTNPKSR